MWKEVKFLQTTIRTECAAPISGVSRSRCDQIDWTAARVHAERCYPDESCGLIIAGEYFPCNNVADDKRTGFEIHASILASAGDRIEVLVHSHGDGPAYPSASDME